MCIKMQNTHKYVGILYPTSYLEEIILLSDLLDYDQEDWSQL